MDRSGLDRLVEAAAVHNNMDRFFGLNQLVIAADIRRREEERKRETQRQAHEYMELLKKKEREEETQNQARAYMKLIKELL